MLAKCWPNVGQMLANIFEMKSDESNKYDKYDKFDKFDKFDTSDCQIGEIH